MAVTAYAFVGEGVHGIPCDLTPDGRFTARDLAPGTYLVEAGPAADPIPPGEGTERGHVLVTIRDGDLTDVALQTAPGVTVRGRVRFEAESADVVRPPGIVVRASLALTERSGPDIHAGVEGDLSFALHTVRGPRILRADHVTGPDGAQWWFTGVLLDGRDVTNEPIDFAAHAGGDLVVTYTPRPAAIVGRVEDIAGLTVSGACVVLLPDNHDLRRGWSTAVGTFVTDRRSRFYFVAIPPGNYVAAAYDQPTCPDRADLVGADDLDLRFTPIEVRAATTARVLVTATTRRPPP
jgi:hypothetical protein